jgi:hypothetical protein
MLMLLALARWQHLVVFGPTALKDVRNKAALPDSNDLAIT